MIIFTLASCSNFSKKKRTFTDTRLLIGISNDSLKIRTEYHLIKTIADSIIEFEYLSKTDSIRNFNARYNKSKSELILGFTGYSKKDDNCFINQEISNFGFDSYVHTKTEIDGMEPILFNQKHGILAIGNPLGSAAVFTKNKPELKVVNRIIEKLY